MTILITIMVMFMCIKYEDVYDVYVYLCLLLNQPGEYITQTSQLLTSPNRHP